VHEPDPAEPVQVSCDPHAVVFVTPRQPLLSGAHVTCVDGFSQDVPVTVHAGTGSHVQEPEPGFPVHV